MHGPTCVFWTNLTPFSPKARDVHLTVKAGSVVVKHNDLWHRVSRSGVDGVSNEGVPWRPMFSGGFFRGSEPTAAAVSPGGAVAAADLATLGGDDAEAAVWAANLSWLLGGGRGSLGALAARAPAGEGGEVAELAGAMARSGSADIRRINGVRNMIWIY